MCRICTKLSQKLRRVLLGELDPTETEQAAERERQYANIKRGLHEAASRVYRIELDSELMARGIKPPHKRRSGD